MQCYLFTSTCVHTGSDSREVAAAWCIVGRNLKQAQFYVFKIMYSENDNITQNSDNGTLFSPKNHILDTTFFVCTITSQITVMLSMGAIITLQEIREHFQRPLSILIALALQYIGMPAVGFGLVNLAQLPPTIALSAMILACCPGGTASNLFSFLCYGDVSLSIMLTTISTILAVGFMPLNLWIYAQHWEGGDQLKVPYKSIAITLAWILIPLFFGMLAKKFCPKLANVINHVGSILGLISIFSMCILQYIMFPEAFNTGWTLWLMAVTMPTVGFTFGYLFSIIAKLNVKQCKTISFETGIQSVGLATTVVVTSFPTKMHGQMTPVLIMFAIYVTIVFLILSVVLRIINYLNKRKFDRIPSVDKQCDEMNTFN
uniref:Ileal sodium/bile acid cotransporter n=1 Tax=Strigamia maritima TaxID=126957 RepID=T1IHS0_STRMM